MIAMIAMICLWLGGFIIGLAFGLSIKDNRDARGEEGTKVHRD
jgi:hypothetical protein